MTTPNPFETSDLTPRIFDPEALGSSLRQLAIDVVPGSQTSIVSRWFRSLSHDADLVIWCDSEKRIVKHQLCFFGQIVEWTPVDGTRTGALIEEEITDGAEGSVSETIFFDSSVDLSVVRQASELLTHVGDLSEDDRKLLIYNLRESPRLHKNARERALKVWGPQIAEIHSNQRPTFWKRLRNWVLGT